MKMVATLVPIITLILLGLVISLRSGIEASRDWDRRHQLLRANFSRLMLRLFGLLTGLFVVHRLIGLPIVLNW